MEWYKPRLPAPHACRSYSWQGQWGAGFKYARRFISLTRTGIQRKQWMFPCPVNPVSQCYIHYYCYSGFFLLPFFPSDRADFQSDLRPIGFVFCINYTIFSNVWRAANSETENLQNCVIVSHVAWLHGRPLDFNDSCLTTAATPYSIAKILNYLIWAYISNSLRNE